MITKRFRLQVITCPRPGHAFFDQGGEIDVDLLSPAGASFAGPEHLLDSVHQAIGVFQHELVELAPLRFFNLPPLQGLQVEPDGCDRRLQLVSYRIDEAIVLLIAADFADEETGVQDQPGHNCAKENDAEENLNFLLPVENDPSKPHRYGGCGEEYAKREEEDDFAAPGNAHRRILAEGSAERASKLY